MFLLRKPQQISNRQMQPGETLFQYLKRKKQIALRQSVEKEMDKRQSRQVQNQSMATTYINQKQLQQKTAINSGRSSGMSTRRKQRKSSSKKKKLVDSSIDSNKNSKKQKQNNFSLMNVMDNDIFKDDKTTRRTVLHSRDSKQMSINIQKRKFVNDQQEIQENKKNRSRSPFRSFISMISPLKNKCENNLSTSLSNTKCFQKQNINEQQPHKKGSVSIKTAEFSTKKTIKQAMSKVQKHYNKQIQFQLTLKQKIREFIISTNSFLVHIEDDLSQSDKNSFKKLTNLKSQMKVLNSFIQSQSREEQNNQISHLIESLYQQINQSLNQYEGQVNKSSLSNCQQSIQKMKSQYQQKIQQLNKQKTRLGRQISLVNKDHGKVVRDYDKLLAKYNQLVQQSEKMKKIQKSQQHQVKQLYEEQINKLAQENNTLSQSLKSLTKQLKNTQHNYQQYKIKVQTQRTQKTTARQAYLLKQISALKQQCASDIENINKYYLSKLQFYPGRIKALEETIDDQKQKIYQLSEKLAESNERIRIEEKQKKQVRVKLQSSLVDMCKMNQELFRHWLSLKDIKTLSLRLGMFDKFERIYRDIPFDDRMFLL